jgi:hypothetical protein
MACYSRLHDERGTRMQLLFLSTNTAKSYGEQHGSTLPPSSASHPSSHNLAHNIVPLGEERDPILQHLLLVIWQVFPFWHTILWLH